MKIIEKVINIHQCPAGHQLISRRVDSGITPLTITCRSCVREGRYNVKATSLKYNVDQSLEPTHEWYRAAFPDRILDLPTREHALRGGLLLREVGEGDYTTVLSDRPQKPMGFSSLAMRALTNRKAKS